MPPIVLFALQALFLLLLYVFVARAVRAVLADLRAPAPPPVPQQPRARTRPPRAAATSSPDAAARQQRPADRGRGTTPGQLVVQHADRKPQVIDLDGAEVRLGRNEACDAVVRDSYASDRHARVFTDAGGWVLADMGSTNGTYLNRERIHDPAPLMAGDTFTIGKTVVEVRR